MKTKDKGQTAPRRKSKFKREEVSQNIWHYSDEHESAFVHECLWLWEVDISEVDNFLAACRTFSSRERMTYA